MRRKPDVPASSAPPLGRKRTANFDLPPRMARKGVALYYVTKGQPRRWIPLGADLARAKRLWARYESFAPSLTVGELAEQYVDDHEGAGRTIAQYRSYCRSIAAGFPDLPADELTAPMLGLWCDENRHRKGVVNGCLAVLKGAYKRGRRLGIVTADPARDVDAYAMAARDRYVTDAEFVRVRAKAPRWLALAMDLARLTGARPVDLRSLRWDAIGADALTLRQQKTGTRQAFAMSPELAAVLETARARPVVGLYVIATDKGRPIGKATLERAWAASCVAAGVRGAQFRDLRGKTATEASEDGQNAQAMLGHASARMTDRYIRGRRTVKAEPLRRKIKA